MKLIKLTKNEEALVGKLPSLSKEHVEAIAALIRGASYDRFVSEDEFCCASEAVDDMPRVVADFILNAYGIKNNLLIRDRDHEDYKDEDEDE